MKTLNKIDANIVFCKCVTMLATSCSVFPASDIQDSALKKTILTAPEHEGNQLID